MTRLGKYTLDVTLINNTACCDIDGRDLIYTDVKSHHGLQCNHIGGTPEHNRIIELCKQVSELMKQIHSINHEGFKIETGDF
jgi:hypothetical protein